MIYQFRTGQTFCGIDAQTAGEELERIRLSNDGRLRPEDVLNSAVDASSPLHGAFTWDDAKAAYEYRLSEARFFIKAVVTVGEQGETAPAFWNIITTDKQDEPERYYQAASVIAGSPIEYDAALRVMLTELATAKDGLEKLQHLAPKAQRAKVARASSLVESAHGALQ